MPKPIDQNHMRAQPYPEAANAYDSLADAYRAAGKLREAKRNHEKAVGLAKEVRHQNLSAYQSKLEQATRELEEQ